jgi:hypothetical protein
MLFKALLMLTTIAFIALQILTAAHGAGLVFIPAVTIEWVPMQGTPLVMQTTEPLAHIWPVTPRDATGCRMLGIA